MSRDRLAQIRAQQQARQNQDNNGQEGRNYPQQSAPSPYEQQDYRGGDRYGQQSDIYGNGRELVARSGAPLRSANNNNVGTGAYEMSSMGASNGGNDTGAFLAEINSIKTALRTFQENVNQIEDLHSRSLVNISQDQVELNHSQLEQKLSETRNLTSTIKNRIKKLEGDAVRMPKGDRDRVIVETQVQGVKKSFMNQIQSFQQVEKQYRQKYKARMEREYRIVKPDASPEEIQSVINDKSGGQVFQQALLNSNRYGDARSALREVEERHEDIKRINQTIVELDQLFLEMSVLIEQQDNVVERITQQAEQVDTDVEQALDQTNKAVVSARAARRKRWICFFIIIILIIVAAVAIVLGVPGIVRKN